MFLTYGPFLIQKAQYTYGKFSFMAGVTNPTDFKTTLEAGPPKKRLLVS
jgi:hypothetical protein